MFENSELVVRENVEKRRGIITISVFSTFFAIWLFSLLSGYGTATNLIAALISFAFVFIVLSMSTINKSIVAFLLFYLYHILTSLLNVSSVYYLFGTCIAYTLVVYSPIFADQIRIVKDKKQTNKSLFKIASFVWLLIVLISIFTFINNPEGGRAYITDHRGVLLGGGYSATYASAVLGVVLFNYFLSGDINVKKKRLYLLLGFLVSFIHVAVTLSTITLFGLIVGCVLSLAFHGNKKKNSIKEYLFLGIVIFAIIFFMVNTGSIGDWLIRLSGKVNNTIYSKRLYEVGMYLSYGNETYHVGNRLLTLSTSWETFIKYPLFGIGYKYGNDYTLLYQNGIGVHSEFLDLLAKYGIVGSISLFYLFFRQIKRIIWSSSKSLGIPLVLTLLVLTFFNPFISAQTMFILFLYIPLLIDIVEGNGRCVLTEKQLMISNSV